MNYLNHDKTGLFIFDNFEIDESLPKYQSSGERDIIHRPSQLFIRESQVLGGASGTISAYRQYLDGHGVVAVSKDNLKEWMGRKLQKWADRLRGHKSPKDVKRKRPSISVEEFFKSIKNSKAQLTKLDKRLEGYEAALAQAKEFGQTALQEKLISQIGVIRSESQLFANNIVKVVMEEQAVTFYKESERGIRLDWIKNFTRQIPQKFLDTKKKLDDLKVFDNYVIMHYDPEGKNRADTQKEIEKKKDPILFGVIANSRKLYYIGDWVDELCDLTLDKMFDKFGKEAILKNNLKAEIDVQ